MASYYAQKKKIRKGEKEGLGEKKLRPGETEHIIRERRKCSQRKNHREWGKENWSPAENLNIKKMREVKTNSKAKSVWGEVRKVYVE